MLRRAAYLLMPLMVGLSVPEADAQTRIRLTAPEEPLLLSIDSNDLTLPAPRQREAGSGFMSPPPGSSTSWGDALFLGAIGGLDLEIFSGSDFAAGIGTRGERPRHRLDFATGDSTLEFGAFGEVFFDDWKIVARVGQDLSDSGGGFVADLGVRWASQVSDRWRVELGSEISWASADYMSRMYGGGRHGGGPGLRLYDPSPGIKDLTVSGSVSYSISDSWTIGGIVGAQRLMGAAADSPATKDDNEYFGGLSLDYRF